MPGIFDSKLFNAEVFQGYVDRIPNLKLNRLIHSRAIRPRPDLAAAMRDQTGGNYITTTLRGLIGGNPLNYDGATNITTNKTKTFKHSRVVVGRANAWTEMDFSFDITGGEDFLENVAQQIADYWNGVDQSTVVHILNGIFNMTGDANSEFVNKHTHNVCAIQNANGVTGYVDQTTFNTAMQKACGANKSAFTLMCMHSVVATNLENLKLLVYLKYNDANGMERELGLATMNGRLVLIDDEMPAVTIEASDAVDAVTAVQGVYTLNVSAAAVEGDKLEISLGSKKVVSYIADGAATAAAVAGTLRRVCAANPDITDLFTVGGSSANVTFTQKVGGTGAAPTVNCTQVETTGTIAAAVTTTTPGVAAVAAKAAVTAHAEYTTYLLGDGAIEMTDCGAKVPYEVNRDPATNGGQDTLYSRQRKSFAPFGISFTNASVATMSPTDAELELGVNWELVNSQEDIGTEYIDHRSIPIARVISLG